MRKRKMTPSLITGIGALACALLLAACPTPTDEPANEYPLLGKVLILQAYGTYDKTDGAVSHCFVELYNVTDEAVDVSGSSIQYAAPDSDSWNITSLTGSIPAHSSYLVRGWAG
ncbi:MAG: hypothetical protein LBF63_07465, partial [Treponema sp.]|nr:hypothetical protein [Treponema sp.]